MTVITSFSSGGDEKHVKHNYNYDCTFAGGKERRKYFTRQFFCIFPPVYPTGSLFQPPSVFNSGSWSVRLKLNRQPSLRQRRTPIFLRNYTQPASGFTVR
ncbi:Hypp1240 [Branchiostoma lanceolatum]|uniref:Hypp1240 protein n=1 Tax=Branchiostoma lanceolatum TaxID=7740 RepID=A0A8J9ZHX4_BRALA|nr:Hypp1240 [Branchiostoma lanceolatum]